MGSSWVSLGKEIPEDKQTEWLGMTYGFWVKDAPLVAWLAATGEIVDELDGAPDWLKTLRADWVEADSGSGCVYPRYKDYVTDDERRALMLDVTLRTLQRLLDFGGDYYAAFASTRPECSGAECQKSLAISDKIGLIEVGSNVARLLCDAMKAGEHSPYRWGYAPSQNWLSGRLEG